MDERRDRRTSPLKEITHPYIFLFILDVLNIIPKEFLRKEGYHPDYQKKTGMSKQKILQISKKFVLYLTKKVSIF